MAEPPLAALSAAWSPPAQSAGRSTPNPEAKQRGANEEENDYLAQRQRGWANLIAKVWLEDPSAQGASGGQATKPTNRPLGVELNRARSSKWGEGSYPERSCGPCNRA